MCRSIQNDVIGQIVFGVLYPRLPMSGWGLLGRFDEGYRALSKAEKGFEGWFLLVL